MPAHSDEGRGDVIELLQTLMQLRPKPDVAWLESRVFEEVTTSQALSSSSVKMEIVAPASLALGVQ